MTKEKDTSLTHLYEQSLKDIREGQLVKGRIVGVNPKDVLVDVGYKSEGLISLEEFGPGEKPVIGQEIEVLVEAKEDDSGMVVLSWDKAQHMKGWEKVSRNSREGDLIEGKVKKKVNGGFLVDVFGIEGFLPASLSAFKGISDDDILGRTFKFKILKLNNTRRSLILSRKDAIHREKEEARGKLWAELKVGDIRWGVVKGITDFGAFVDLGGVDGLLHITDMSWSRVSHPSEVVALGDKIEVAILSFDKEQEKVSLGLKQRLPDPWEGVDAKYPVGSKITGKIVNILPYGVFVELEKGVEGLIHISEISWQKRVVDPKEHFAIGDMVEVQVLSVDKESRRIALSIKQLEVNPWLEAEKRYPAGSRVTGRVKGFTDYGAFVELDANLEGMIHISDLSWTRKVSHPQEVLKKGQKIDALVVSVDGKNRRIALGLKQLTPNPWPEIAQRYPLGKTLEAEVISITNFGVFVKLEEELEGLIFASEIDKAEMEGLKPQDKVQAKIIKVDQEQFKIGLSRRL